MVCAERDAQRDRDVIALLVAIVLLLLALLIMAFGVPEWNADGSRDDLREPGRGDRDVPARAPLAVLVGVVGLISAPLELWLLALTDAEEPGTEARRDEMDDWDWD